MWQAADRPVGIRVCKMRAKAIVRRQGLTISKVPCRAREAASRVADRATLHAYRDLRVLKIEHPAKVWGSFS